MVPRHRSMLCALCGLALAAMSLPAEPGKVDMPGLVAHNDVIYLSPARQGWEGLPLGNGTLGAQAWQPDGFVFQINTPLSGVYGGALARLKLRTTPAMLTGMSGYRQRLSLYDATLRTDITTDTGDIHAACFIPADTDALVVELRDRRTAPEGIERFVEIETWRPSARHAVEGNLLLVTDTLKVGGEPDYKFALVAGVDGTDAVAETPSETSHLLRVPGGHFTLWVAVAASRDANADVPDLARRKLADLRTRGIEATRQAHANWWAKFWDKSFISLASADGTADYVANLWYMHIYAMAAGSRGEVPPKFNGGPWTDNRDEREWGTAYWHWNTQETTWPLFAANHIELHRPYQDMYWAMLPRVKRWTKETWELDGAQYQETIPFNGAMGVWQKETGVHPRVPVPKQVAYTNLILSSSAEIAMQFWWAYLYTGDETFLRERAYPLMKEVAAFYVGYLEKDAAGHYNVWPSNAHESFWKVKNPATDLAALRYFFPAIIDASQRLNVDADLRATWQDRLDHLAPYPIDPKTGAILPYELQPGELLDWKNAENPELFPIGVFPLIGIDSPEYELGLKTFHARHNVNVYGWTTDSIAAARLGLAEAAPPGSTSQQMGLVQLLPGHAEAYQNHPSGLQDYYSRRPAIHPYLEGSGTFAAAVGEMLLQSWNNTIRVCPALPKAWSADFRLLAMGGFEVTGHAQNGTVTRISFLSLRGGPVSLVNPFDGPVNLTSPSVQLQTNARFLKFDTEAGQTYTVTRAGDTPPAREITAKPNETPKRLTPASRRWLGKPELASTTWRPPAEPGAPQPPAPVQAIDRPSRPEVRPARFAAAPTIDGELSEDVWKSAKSLGPFFRLGQKAPASEQTDVLVGHDDTTIYFGVICWESRMDALQAEFEAAPENRDLSIFEDDSVEIFLEPAPGTLWHFIVNVLGAVYDARGSTAQEANRQLNPEWKACTQRRSNRWVVEVAIPFDSIVPDPPQAGEAWGFNVGRNERPHGETTTFAPLSQARFHLPEDFARLIFVDVPQPQPAPPADPDLVGHWTFDDLRGSWVRDSSGHRHHGLMTSLMKAVDGKVGKALEYAGATYVDIPDAPDLNLTDAMTLAVWVMPTHRGSMRLIDKGPAGGSDAYLLDTHPDNNLRVITRAGTVQCPEKLPLNEWSHVAVTFGDRTLRVYLNGKMISETGKLGAALSLTKLPLRLGADSVGSNRFTGRMDDARVYRKALSAESIAELCKAKP